MAASGQKCDPESSLAHTTSVRRGRLSGVITPCWSGMSGVEDPWHQILAKVFDQPAKAG